MKIVKRLSVCLLVAFLTGCASTGGYLVDRGRDAADICTATLGAGAGTKARVGPLQLGALVTRDVFGLRGGRIAWWWPRDRASGNVVECDFFILPLFGFGIEDFEHEALYEPERHKEFMAMKPLPFAALPLAGDAGPHEWERSREYWHYYTQIEAVVALGPSFRLGFNAGELLDFILGWTTIDIFKDDVEKRTRIEHQNPALSPAAVASNEA
jgi:hypothetical protein